MTSIRSVASIILVIPSGVFADYYGRKSSIIIAIICQIIGFILLLVGSSFGVLIIANIFVGAYFAFMNGPDVAIVYESLKTIGEEKRFKLNQTIKSGIILFSLSLASLIGGLVAEKVGFRLVILLNVIAYTLALICALFLKEPQKINNLKNASIYLHLKDSLNVLLKNTNLFAMSIILAIFSLTLEVSQSIIQPYLKQAGLNIKYFGFINALFLVIAGISSFAIIYLNKNDKSTRRHIFFSTIFIIIQFLILSLFLNTYVAVIAVSILQIAKGTSAVVISDYTNKHTDEKNRATVFSIQGFIVSILSSLAIPMFGLISDKSNNIQVTYFSLATFVLIIGLIVGSIIYKTKLIGIYNKLLGRNAYSYQS